MWRQTDNKKQVIRRLLTSYKALNDHDKQNSDRDNRSEGEDEIVRREGIPGLNNRL